MKCRKYVIWTAAITLALVPALHSEESDTANIVATMRALFEAPAQPLTVKPVVVEEDEAIASWTQDSHGGRAFLRRQQASWHLVLCSGESPKTSRDSDFPSMQLPAWHNT